MTFRFDPSPSPLRGQARRRQARETAFARAMALHDAGQLDAAEAIYRGLLAGRPRDPEVLSALAFLRLCRGHPSEAAQLVESALARHPNAPRLLGLRGLTLIRQWQFAEAEPFLARAFAGEPENHEIRGHYGRLLEHLRRHEEAVRVLAPVAFEHVENATSMAGALLNLGRNEEALPYVRFRVARQPNDVQAHVDLGIVLLQLGEYREGFREWAWATRIRSERWLMASPVPGPAWDGSGAIAGRRVLVNYEGGLGDTLCLARFLVPLAARGAVPLLRCQPALKALLQGLPGAAAVVGDDEPPPFFDRQVPIVCLPMLLDTTLDNLPAEVPYLRAEPERIARWRTRIRPDRRLTVGVVWSSSPDPSNLGRSFPLRLLAPLASLPGVRLLALQKEHGREQLGDLPPGMVVEDLGPDLDAEGGAFLDTAAVMTLCDLVISADTSSLHLAGALARPTWLAVKKVHDWRWLLRRDDSPWYPTLRLFRQEREGEWAPVFARMTTAMEPLLRDRIR